MKSLTAVTFIAGLLMAASDGSLFPWLNLAGVGIFALSVPLMARWRG